MRVSYVADGVTEGEAGGDSVQVTGPDGTSCAGSLVGQGVQGPNSDSSGPVSLYIGPAAGREYAAATNTYDPMVANSEHPLVRWCPGQYTGEIVYNGPIQGVVKATFEFRIAANKHVAPLPSPAVARHLRPVAVSPRSAGRRTVVTIHYHSDAVAYDRGDVIEVDGPRHSACKGAIVRAIAERPDQGAGPLTLHIGPGAGRNKRWKQQFTALPPFGAGGTGSPLRNWCSGTYNGTIFYEHGPKFTVIARFAFHVAR